MGKTSIEWTDASWNPIVGCTEISPGCAHCYAARLAGTRLRQHPDYLGLTDKFTTGGIRKGWNGAVRFLANRLEEPLHWRKPRRIFVCDMGDLFHELVTDEQIVKVFRTIALGGGLGHTFQILTKRAKRMHDFMRADHGVEWIRPMPWLWLGVSVENQRFADERIPLLLKTPAAVRWISAEPLLGSLNLQCIKENPNFWLDSIGGIRSIRPCLDWVVCGGESGTKARAMHPEWARSLRNQCMAAGVPFFFKQWGEWAECGIKLGKKESGRLLDGREWNEFPPIKQWMAGRWA